MASTPTTYLGNAPTTAVEPARLRRQLGLWSATALVVSNMVGTGIFTSTGFMAGDLGNAWLILLTWMVGAGFALAGALVYSQLAMWHPESGGEYLYLTKAYGRSWGFMSGWVSFFAGFSAPIAAAALAFSDYLAFFFPSLSSSKAALTLGSGNWAIQVGPAQLVACLLIGAFTLLNMLRIELVARVQNSLTLIKVAAIAAFILLGIAIGKGDWSHFSTPALRTSAAPIQAQFLVSLLWVMVGYSGWNAATYVAGEIKNPERTLPKSLVLGTSVVAVLYLGLNLVFIYATPLESMKGVLRVGAFSASNLFGPGIAGVFSALMALAIMSTVNAMVTAGPRVYYAMARNGAFPALAGQVSDKSQTPVKAVVAQSICAMAMTVTSFPQLVVFIGFTLTIFTTLAVASVFILGKGKRPMWAPAIAYCVLGTGTVVYGFIWQPTASTAALAVIFSGALAYHSGLGRPGQRRLGRMKKTVARSAAVLLLAAIAYPVWKPVAKKNKWFMIATNVGQDTIRRVGWTSSQIGQGATIHLPESGFEAEIRKVRAIYAQYLAYSGGTPLSVTDRRVIELGPGFTIAVPLLFAADGAKLVVGIDKFVKLQTGDDFRAFYSRLREGLSRAQQAGFDRAMRIQPGVALNSAHARYIYHKELQDSIAELGAGQYDLIVSNAVMEEIYDPTPSLRAQGELLRPGGVMVHRIDLGDYDMFSKNGFHPLEFLTVPEWVYRRMVADAGQPNRRLVNYYRDTAKKMGYQSDIYITRVLGIGELPEARRELRAGIDYGADQLKLVRDIRHRLEPRFRSLSDEDLLAWSIVFVARKP